MRTLLFVVCSAATLSFASPCDSGPEVRRALRKWDAGDGRIPFAERRAQLDALAARYPDAIEVHGERLWLYRVWRLDLPAIRQAALERAAAQPEDPLALTLAAMHLHRVDTPRAIEFAKRALAARPGYAWAALTLTEIHADGRWKDLPRASEYFGVFVAACPDRLPRRLDRQTSPLASPDLQRRMAQAMRARLEAENVPEEALDYERLWALEFRATPPAGHGAVRERLARDLAQLAAMESADPEFLSQLTSGARQSGAPPERVAEFEDRLLAQAPDSRQAYYVVYQRWRKQHPEPKDHRDADAWHAWIRELAEAQKAWSESFPAQNGLRESYLGTATDAGMVDEAAALAEFEQLQRSRRLLYPPIEEQFALMEHAYILGERGWAAATVTAWMGQAWTLAEDVVRVQLAEDTRTAAEVEFAETWTRPPIAAGYLRALARTGGKEVPPSMRQFVERPVPKSGGKVDYFVTRARLAQVDGRAADALAYYQAALRERTQPAAFYRGVLRDELLADAKAFFLKHGGTETGFALWSAPPKPPELRDGRWEKPAKALPAFELSDLEGRTWKLKQLEGRALLINLWATWCGPCRTELPHLQKLYEQTKGRTDVQVLTFNVDDEVGLVAPFMKENRYTFPVLLAADLVNSMFQGWGIPQSWVVDSKGKWIATQMGFDEAEADWIEGMIRRLEQARVN